ncbi:MAG TPA: tRNA preQ1(34) S-adenosylmethionine ribosyltransferase-isomerase QueA [Pyrinomonadaceae bacterium]|nr:tRNA preQ1(34) S-adenosylmethionine ribosyltransferase-isomerase QueA [Pyrinomonadaceae bacterium]
MRISDFEYDLPEELIAQHPLERRDASRMLVLDRSKQTWRDSTFTTLSDYLGPSDLLVINNTRVFPARLSGERYPSGGRVEVLLVRETEGKTWEALIRPGQRLKTGAKLQFGNGRLKAELLDSPGHSVRLIRFHSTEQFQQLLGELGQTPLPPYIKRPEGDSPDDRERYQTVFAHEEGAIAAPTAGLHFTPEILQRVRARGTSIVEITLHVGYGTFEPVRVENVEEHRVAAEAFAISDEAAKEINAARTRGGRILAVGTTTARALESAVTDDGPLPAIKNTAHLTITPGYNFRIVDGLLTNFHLPRSSLLLLVSAFAGRELVLEAYRHAVANRYRFYSYGDCMLIL